MFQIKEEICMRLKCNISHSIGQIYSKKIGLFIKRRILFFILESILNYYKKWNKL